MINIEYFIWIINAYQNNINAHKKVDWNKASSIPTNHEFTKNINGNKGSKKI